MAKQRRGRVATDYVRRGPQREPYESILIVCEGEKTEPNYLSGLRTTYRLSSANIKIVHPDATDPMSIVNFAETELGRKDEGYDRVYCVFDRDGHANYDTALQRIQSSQHGILGRLRGAISVPCFEIWLLLHFRYSAAPFAASGKRSACDKVLRELQKYLPSYQKGDYNVFNMLSNHLDKAIANAIQLEQYNQKTGTSNPATGMHHLIKHLRCLNAASHSS